MNRPAIGAALLTVAAVGSILMVAREWAAPGPVASAEQICVAVADVRDAVDLSSLGDQAVLGARAAQLADLLSGVAEEDGPAGSTSRAQQIVAVLDDPKATVADLAVAIEPLVRQCRD